jgi:group II intron reverse transcriptase/maturase
MGPLMGNMEDTLGSGNVYTKQQRIAQLAARKPEAVLTTLAHHVDMDWLSEAYRRTRKDAAAGVDRVTAADYEQELESNLSSLLERFKSGSYRAPAVRRVYIPKGAGGKPERPIGIPTLEDKVLQRAVAMVLEPVYEHDFLDCSYGYRPGRSAHQALDRLWHAVMKTRGSCWLLEADIRGCFDNISHEHMREIVHKRVRDGVISRVIGKWLKAGIMEDGQLRYPHQGTPQGGVISPLLANIYLHEVLDSWFEHQVRPRMVGKAELVRFADDFVVVFSKAHDAQRVYEVLPKRFARFGLEIHPGKSRLLDFSRPGTGGDKPGTFSFLGFTHHWGKSRKGNWVVRRKTSGKKLVASIRRIYQWCKLNRHMPVSKQRDKLSRKLKGHYGYYGITGNGRSLYRFYEQVRNAWQKWLDRRSRGHDMPWERFKRLLKRYPLPLPRIVHQYSQ